MTVHNFLRLIVWLLAAFVVGVVFINHASAEEPVIMYSFLAVMSQGFAGHADGTLEGCQVVRAQALAAHPIVAISKCAPVELYDVVPPSEAPKKEQS